MRAVLLFKWAMYDRTIYWDVEWFAKANNNNYDEQGFYQTESIGKKFMKRSWTISINFNIYDRNSLELVPLPCLYHIKLY